MSRIEHDFLGDLEIPDDVYYGVQSLRGKENFHIPEHSMKEDEFFIKAFAQVKKAAARTNKELGTIPANVADALIYACDQLLEGKYRDQFVTDWLQGGAGTSTNMNTNAVICSIACERLGLPKGSQKQVSPNAHANFGQSTRDTYPPALHLAMYYRSADLLKALQPPAHAYNKTADDYKNVLTTGRTHRQDAVPMSMGQEFHGWGRTIEDEIETIKDAQKHLRVINLGGTAIGTTVTCHPDYPAKAVKYLAEQTGIDLHNSDDLIAATSDCGAYVAISSAVKSLAVKLTKVCNDMRLLASGPRTGLSEINLPMRQPGSSIMPGKVNPTQCEAVTMVAVQVMGNDAAIGFAASQGNFELNGFKPVIAYNLLQSIRLLADVEVSFAEHCVDGITANKEKIDYFLNRSLMNVTALSPLIGYENAAKVAHYAHENDLSLRDAALALKVCTPEEFDATVVPANMVHPLKKAK